MNDMTSNDEFRQYTAFARIDGAIMGLMWIASFFCFIGEFQMPLLSIVAIALGLASVAVATIRLRIFRDNVLGGSITFGRATLYSILTYFYAALLMALAQFVYFQFLDHGYLINQYIATLSTPEYAATVKSAYGIEAKQLIAILQSSMGSLRPIEIAFQFLTLNVILGIILSIPAGAIIRRVRNEE